MPKPSSFDEELASEWNAWVLDNSLPTPPRGLSRGQSVPVARYAGSPFGAVMHLQWSWDEEEPDEDYVATEVYLFRRSPDGWEEASGSGGSNWHDDENPFRRADIADDRAWLGGETGAGGEGWYACAIDGMTGIVGVAVAVTDSDGRRVTAIDNSLGICLAAVDGTTSATVEVLANDGRAIASYRYDGSHIRI